MATPDQIDAVIKQAYGISPQLLPQATLDATAKAIDAGVPISTLVAGLARSESYEQGAAFANAIAATIPPDQKANVQAQQAGLSPAPAGYSYTNNNGTYTLTPNGSAPAAAASPPPPPGANTAGGHYVPAGGNNGKSYWMNADGSIATDANGAPALYDLQDAEAGANARAGAAEAGANARNAATIASNEKLAAEQNRIAEDQFNRKFSRDNFVSDRAFQQAHDQFIATFNQSENQFGATQAGLDRRAAAAEQGVNDRFAAQMSSDNANAQNTYGLTSTNNQNNYNLSAFTAQENDALSRYKAQTDRQQRLSELALKREQDTRDILSKPSDALARLFFSRGGTSPVAFTSRADLIDRLNAQIKGAIPADLPAAIPFPTYQAPPAYITPAPYVPRVTAPAPAYVPTPAPGSGGGGGASVNTGSSGPNGSAGGGLSVVNGQAVFTGSNGSVTSGSFAEGGLTRVPIMRVGDDPSGKPNDTEETIVNPTNAPIGVIPNPATVSKLSSKQGADQAKEEDATKKKMDGIRKLMQHVDSPDTMHALVDELAGHQSKLTPRAATGVPRYYLGTPDLNNLDGLDTPTDQTQLLSDAVASTSPGGQALLDGTQAAPLQFGGGLSGQAPLPSAIQYGRLTSAEKDNLNTSLAARYNTDLQDLTDQLDQRYGGTRTRAQARLTVR